VVDDLPQRRVVLATIAFLLTGIATGSHYWSRLGVDAAALDFEVRLAEHNPANDLDEVIFGDGRTIFLHQQTIVTNSDIARAEVVQGQDSTLSVSVVFTADGAAKMSRASQTHIGKPLAILVDGQIVAAPIVRSPVTTSATISGDFTRAEAERIVAGILGR
jgi:preprotein translocase subunit SecD